MENFNTLIVSLASILLSGNIFFIKRLIDKLEATSTQRQDDHASIKQLFKDISEVTNQLKELRNDIKEIKRIEIEVAVLRDRMRNLSSNDS